MTTEIIVRCGDVTSRRCDQCDKWIHHPWDNETTCIDCDQPDDDWPRWECINCGTELYISGKETCSDKCQDALDKIEANTGQCAWCGRHGPVGKSCVRRVPGTDEFDECGTFG